MQKSTLTFLFLLLLIRLSAQSLADKRISISAEDESLTEVLLTLGDLADVNISFSPKLLPKDKKINVAAENEPLKLVLQRCLDGTKIGYRLDDGQIILFKIIPKKYTLSGILTDAETGERLVGANVWEVKTSNGGASNAYGFYSQTFTAGKLTLQFSYLGYQTATLTVDLQKAKTLDVALKPELTLTEITVVADREVEPNTLSALDQTLPLQKMSQLPTVAGERDVMRYLQVLPGVQSGADGFGGLHVRGGNSDQNLILLDDVPVYNPSHTFGLFSIFNPDLARSVKFYKSDFPARYDGRISSILDVRTREGNSKNFTGEVTFGTMATKAVLEFPLGKGKGGILAAARHSHINSWLRPLSRNRKAENDESVGEMNYRFTDLNLKAHYSLGQRDKIYFSQYLGSDRFGDATTTTVETPEEELPLPISFDDFIDTDFATEWGNTISSLRWNHIYNDKLFSNTTATYSSFSSLSTSDVAFEFNFGEFDFFAFRANTFYFSTIKDFSLRTDFDYFLNTKNRVAFGVHAVKRYFEPAFGEVQNTGGDLDSLETFQFQNDGVVLDATELNAYFSDDFSYRKWHIRAGVHLAGFLSDERRDFIPQPRLSVDYKIKNDLEAHLSASRSAQFLHLVTKTDSGLPDDFWVPAGRKTPPQKAWQLVAGISGRPAPKTLWRAEIYRKNIDDVLRLNPDSLFSEGQGTITDLQIDASNREEILERGSGTAYGLELSGEHGVGAWNFLANYTLAYSNRTFRNETEPYFYDHRHNINATATYRLNDKINFSAMWTFRTGRPVGRENTRTNENDIPFSEILQGDFIDIKNDRLPAYHRLDLGVNILLEKKKLQHKIYLGLYNAYNRKNVFFIYDAYDFSGQQIGQLAVYSLPFLPSFSYSVKFDGGK